jgi:hypothetical protein
MARAVRDIGSSSISMGVGMSVFSEDGLAGGITGFLSCGSGYSCDATGAKVIEGEKRSFLPCLISITN